MIRTFITPTQSTISINLPEDFVGKKIELIAFSINEAIDGDIVMNKALPFEGNEKIPVKDMIPPDANKA